MSTLIAAADAAHPMPLIMRRLPWPVHALAPKPTTVPSRSTSKTWSALAKTLREQFEPFAKASTMPSHVQLLNWLARAAGHRNYQALRAAVAMQPVSPQLNVVPAPPFDATLTTHATKALTQFDERGRLTRWPHKFAVQRIALWALWQPSTHAAPQRARVNTLINTWATYGDHARCAANWST